MSLLMQAMTSDNDTEITESINLVLKASPLGLIHESINVNKINDYTRSWFACKFTSNDIMLLLKSNRGKQCLRANYTRSSREETSFDLW
jgi:meiotically up-regulated gene 157 (Mug157) protein